MPRNITVTFNDGSTHVYQNAPDTITPDIVQKRAEAQFGKSVTGIDGGKSPDAPTPQQEQSTQATQQGREMNSSLQGAITAMQGPTMGFLDELAGAGSAITGFLANLTPWGDNKTIQENYTHGRNVVRGAVQQYTKDYPKTAIGSQIATSLPLTLASGGVSAPTTLLGRVASGARTGAQYGAISGLGNSEGDTAAKDVENMGIGAGIGGVLGAVVPATVSGVSKAVGWGIDRLQQNSKNIIAGKVLRDMAGSEKGNLEDILQAANPNQTTGQAIAMAGGGNRDEMLALARIASHEGEPNQIRTLADSQLKGNQSLIDAIRGGTSNEASIAAQDAAHKELQQTLDPLRVSGAEAANRNTKILEILRKKASEYANASSQNIQDVRRFTAVGERATERANNTSPISWMPKVAGYMGDAGALADKAEQVATNAAQDSIKSGASANVANNLANNMEARGISTLSAQPLFDAIDTKMAKIGDRANPILTDTLKGFKDHLAQFVDENGNIDAYDLHQLRKNSNDMIDKLFPNADAALKNRAGAVLSSLKPVIDDGLKAAGGGNLVKYFDAYSQGLNKINRMKMADYLSGLSPDEFIAVTKGNNPKAVEDIFGKGNYSFQNQMGESSAPINTVAKRLDANALIEQRGGAPAAMNAAKNILEKDMIGFRLPAYLSKEAATANFGLSKIDSWFNKGTKEALFNAMQSPQETLSIMNTLPVGDRSVFLKALQSPEIRNIISSQSGMLTGKVLGAQQ